MIYYVIYHRDKDREYAYWTGSQWSYFETRAKIYFELHDKEIKIIHLRESIKGNLPGVKEYDTDHPTWHVYFG